MKRKRILSTICLLLVCVSIFGITAFAATGSFSKTIAAGSEKLICYAYITTSSGTMGGTVKTNSNNLGLSALAYDSNDSLYDYYGLFIPFKTGSFSFDLGTDTYKLYLYNNSTAYSTTVTGSYYWYE